MEDSIKRREILSLLTLPIAGGIGLLATLLRGNVVLPIQNAEAWVSAVTASNYPIAQYITIIAYVLPYIGFWGIYASTSGEKATERVAFYGFIGAITGTSFALPTLGVFAYMGPSIGEFYLSGQNQSIQLLSNSVSGIPLAINLTGGTLYLIGAVLLGIAIWKSIKFSKWGGIMIALHGLFLVVGFGMYPLLLLSWILLIIGGSWITWNSYNNRSKINETSAG